MSRRLISIRNDASLGAGWAGNYHAWMGEINEVLAKHDARVVKIDTKGEDYQGAIAFIEITEKRKPAKKKKIK